MRSCSSACRCFNCGNKEYAHLDTSISCRCGEKKGKCKGSFSCTDTANKRKTKCPCFARQRPCSLQCRCTACGNNYGQKNASSRVQKGMKRAAKLTSSPSSLKKKRSSKFLEESKFTPVHGPWTLEENCILDCSESFLMTTCILPNAHNIAHLYNFVVTSKIATDMKISAKAKNKAQVNGRILYARKREKTLEQMSYGVSALYERTTSL